MTSETADPRPINDQGQAPTHPQDTGSNVMGTALRCLNGGTFMAPLSLTRSSACASLEELYEEVGS